LTLTGRSEQDSSINNVDFNDFETAKSFFKNSIELSNHKKELIKEDPKN